MTPPVQTPGLTEVDVVDLSDLRFPGGTGGSIAEEILAQHRTGYTTGLAHIHGPLVAKVSPVNSRIRRCVEVGHAELMLPGQRVKAKIIVARHPAVIQHGRQALPPIDTDAVLVVANAPPQDIDGHEHYDPRIVSRIVQDVYGVEPLWAPIGPLVRIALAEDLKDQRVLADNWVNIIDVDAWQADRQAWVSDRPVIGRHSRQSPQKWPSDAKVLRAVYPTDGSWKVRILGGAGPVEHVLGQIPDAWEVLPFGAMRPRDFLAGIDFFVYYHDPRWVEAFGRTILEALATGAVAVLPPHFKALFGDAAVYAEPNTVRQVVNELYADRAKYLDLVRRGRTLARERFGYEAHARRLAELIGPPSISSPSEGPAAPISAGLGASATAASHRPTEPTSSAFQRQIALSTGRTSDDARPRRILLMSSNGAGMGHLTRLLAMARRCPDDFRPHFLSLSQAVPVVGSFGFPYEYLPSMPATGLAPRRWHAYFRQRVNKVIDRLAPAAVVFDGTWPYEGIPNIREDHPEVPWVWSRRGMWQAGKNADQLAKAAWFDLVLEPGEFAAPADRGATASAKAVRVNPITLLDVDELDERSEARRAVGISDSRPAALVTLGAGNINDTSSDAAVVVEALLEHGFDVCLTHPEIAQRRHGPALSNPSRVHSVSEFPLSRRYRAFDLAVSATGYNSFHELLRFGVPSLFVPNRATALDDQVGRARFAADQGWSHSLEAVTADGVRPLVHDLTERGPEMVAQAAKVDPGNGACEAMSAVVALIRGEAVMSS